MIRFLDKDAINKDIHISLNFAVNDGYCDCEILYDDIAVAYFDTTDGGITALVFEVREDDGSDAHQELKYLMTKGVNFNSEITDVGTIKYWIKLNRSL